MLMLLRNLRNAELNVIFVFSKSRIFVVIHGCLELRTLLV